MKQSQLKTLLKEIIKAVMREDDTASKDIEKAMKSVEDKLKGNKQLSPREASLAVGAITDPSQKTKMAQSMSSTKLSEEEIDGAPLNPIALTVKKDFKSKSGIEFKAGDTVNIAFRGKNDQYASVVLPPGSEKPFMRFPIKHMSVYFNKCQPMPSMKKLEKMNDDGRCSTVLGSIVEPDGHGPHGEPSWLLVIGVI